MDFTMNMNYGDVIDKYLKENLPTVPSYPMATRSCGKLEVTFVPKVKQAIFNPPATIILWNDGTKSVVKCQNGEPFDAEKGFALAYLKKLLGNDNTFNKEIKKWVKWEEPVKAEIDPNIPLTIDQLMTMDGQKVYIVSLGEDGVEDFHPNYTGWRTVNTKSMRVFNDAGYYFNFSDMGTPLGFHAYLTKKKKV